MRFTLLYSCSCQQRTQTYVSKTMRQQILYSVALIRHNLIHCRKLEYHVHEIEYEEIHKLWKCFFLHLQHLRGNYAKNKNY